MYVPKPWTVESAVRWTTSEHGWHAPDAQRPTYLESQVRGRAWVEEADEDTESIGNRLGGFTPSIYVLFEPRLTLADGVCQMMATVFAFSDRRSALVLLYQSEDVLLQATNGRRQVPPAARDWWEGEGVSDLIG